MKSQLILILFLVSISSPATAETLRGAVKCGPPTLLPVWNNETAVVGGRAFLTCPLDTLNSCLVDFVSTPLVFYEFYLGPYSTHFI
jgi:hypothetical protein